ncbi:MAG: pirin family protein [Aureispira sp.]|nr:pirin family protein [Aureispira sp.]
MRSIKRVLPAMKVNMGGIILDQPLPHSNLDQIDPFLLIHHWEDRLPGGQRQQDIGVGPHPHRGFAPVTFIFKGSVHHRDSEGFEDIISGGGTQWMNSGKGIIHSERPGKDLAKDGGDFELIQFWVNAPAKNKMEKPNYQAISKEKTPVVTSKDGKVHVGVVAGKFEGKESSIEAYSPILALRLVVEAGGEMSIPIPKHYNALLYQLDGELEINKSKETNARKMVWFENDSDTIHVKGLRNTRAILLCGEPIGEPVATHGPFVMNSREELMEAIHDYQAGKMGELIEKFD